MEGSAFLFNYLILKRHPVAFFYFSLHMIMMAGLEIIDQNPNSAVKFLVGMTFTPKILSSMLYCEIHNFCS